MKLIKASFEIINQNENWIEELYEPLPLVLKHIERVGNIFYKRKTTGVSHLKFVNSLIKQGNNGMLEHGTVYLSFTDNHNSWMESVKYLKNKDSICHEQFIEPTEDKLSETIRHITTTYGVLVKNNWLDDLQYISEPKHHEKRISVKFVCDRTAYNIISGNKNFTISDDSNNYEFGNELTFIKPCFTAKSDSDLDVYNNNIALQELEYFLYDAEKRYFKLLELGCQPQQARSVLPNALKTEVVVTGFLKDWKQFFVECNKSKYPQIQELTTNLQELIYKQYE